MKIDMLGINEVKVYEKNPRKNAKAVDIVAKSIKEFGFNVPVIIDKDNIIIAGHTRVLAAKKLELKEVPTIKIEDLTEAQVKAFRIMDNKSQEYAEWDIKLLEGELEWLDEKGFDSKLSL